ncbi:MAG TPA: CBS domain-containing protein, partial [Candidatus Aenigmarchaeota archaeon]|nr:CBS domain-containing protein [Candidatus Aenigmarchaeota archaeon]
SEKTIVRNLDRITKGSKVEDIMEEPFPIVSANESLEVIRSLLDYHQAVLISEKGKLVGIVTKSDFLNLLE